MSSGLNVSMNSSNTISVDYVNFDGDRIEDRVVVSAGLYDSTTEIQNHLLTFVIDVSHAENFHDFSDKVDNSEDATLYLNDGHTDYIQYIAEGSIVIFNQSNCRYCLNQNFAPECLREGLSDLPC